MTLPVPSSSGFDPQAGINGGLRAVASEVSDGAKNIGYFDLRCPNLVPLNFTVASGGIPAFASAGAAQIDSFAVPGGFMEFSQATAQTLLPRRVAASEAKGWELGLDQVDNETVEYVPGGNSLGNPFAATIGTTNPFFIRALVEVTNADGMDQFVFGFRKQEAYQPTAAFLAATDPIYTDFAAMGFAGIVVSANPVRIITDLNDSGVPVVSLAGFNWVDGLVHSLEIRVSGRRALYFINGIKLGSRVVKDGLGNTIAGQDTRTPPAFNFDLADVVVPFIFSRQDALLSTWFLRRLQVGPLFEEGLDDNNRPVR